MMFKTLLWFQFIIYRISISCCWLRFRYQDFYQFIRIPVFLNHSRQVHEVARQCPTVKDTVNVSLAMTATLTVVRGTDFVRLARRSQPVSAMEAATSSLEEHSTAKKSPTTESVYATRLYGSLAIPTPLTPEWKGFEWEDSDRCDASKEAWVQRAAAFLVGLDPQVVGSLNCGPTVVSPVASRVPPILDATTIRLLAGTSAECCCETSFWTVGHPALASWGYTRWTWRSFGRIRRASDWFVDFRCWHRSGDHPSNLSSFGWWRGGYWAGPTCWPSWRSSGDWSRRPVSLACWSPWWSVSWTSDQVVPSRAGLVGFDRLCYGAWATAATLCSCFEGWNDRVWPWTRSRLTGDHPHYCGGCLYPSCALASRWAAAWCLSRARARWSAESPCGAGNCMESESESEIACAGD